MSKYEGVLELIVGSVCELVGVFLAGGVCETFSMEASRRVVVQGAP